MSEFRKRGYLTQEEAMSLASYPSQARMEKGPVAVIECPEGIPCNPCQCACPHQAITVGTPITNLPALDVAKCVGCGLCIAHCPGQAIVVVDMSGEQATVSLPYEFLPMPQKGEQVPVLDREGRQAGMGTVIRVLNPTSFDRTAVVTVAVDKELAHRVRAIERRREHVPEC